MRTLISLVALVALASTAAADGYHTLRMKEVDQIIEQHDRAVQSCRRHTIHQDDTVGILLKMIIDEDGKVAEAEPVNANNPRESACIARVVRKLRFRATGGISQIEYPFLLLPQISRR